MGWDIKVDLVPCGSISTYGKCLNGGTGSRARTRKGAAEAKEILIGLDDDEKPDPTAGVRAELNVRESAPPKPGTGSKSRGWGSKAAKPSPCFTTRPRGESSACMRGSLEATPGPNHYNPRHSLTHGSTPIYSVPKTVFKSSWDEEDTESSGSRPATANRPEKAPSTDKSFKGGKGGKSVVVRNDRVSNTLQPWVKSVGSAGSSFRSIERKPLSVACVSELSDTAPDPCRPRSACYVRMKADITRTQRNKTTHGGHSYGHYTNHLNYNKNIHHQNHEVAMHKPAMPIKMNQMLAREQPPGTRQQGWRERVALQEANPALQRLGMPQAAWGSKSGALGGTGETLTRKKSLAASLKQQTRQQKDKVGHSGSKAEPADILYNMSSSIVSDNTVVDYGNMQARSIVMSSKTEGADAVYDYIRPSSVAGPDFSTTPTREQRMKAGFSAAVGSTDTSTDPTKLLGHSVGSRVQSSNFGKATSREPAQIVPAMKYQDQLPTGHPIREIGEMVKSPVRGNAPFVLDMHKMPTREICKKEDKRKGSNRRFGG